jgi:hypothetical protein
MTRYICTESRRVADDVYVAGEIYEIADGLAERYAKYFQLNEAPSRVPTPRASKKKPPPAT